MQRVVLGVVCGALAACGDNARPCEYTELADATNGGAAEPTRLTVGPGTANVCGTIEGGHLDPAPGEVDLDGYRFSAPGTELLVQMIADPGISELGAFSVRLFDGSPTPALLGDGTLDPTLADHGAYIARVWPGDLVAVAVATAAPGAPADLTGAIDYRIRLSPDPSNACPPALEPARYRERGEPNDVIAVDFTAQPSFAPLPGAPERTGLSIASSESYLITGDLDTTPRGDQYLDRDTFEITTADDANELYVRLDWPETTADLDVLVFEAGSLRPVAASTLASTTRHELQIAAVRPRTRYLVWVGAFQGSDETIFDLTICGSHFFH